MVFDITFFLFKFLSHFLELFTAFALL